jgi:hypothetical protein
MGGGIVIRDEYDLELAAYFRERYVARGKREAARRERNAEHEAKLERARAKLAALDAAIMLERSLLTVRAERAAQAVGVDVHLRPLRAGPPAIARRAPTPPHSGRREKLTRYFETAVTVR